MLFALSISVLLAAFGMFAVRTEGKSLPGLQPFRGAGAMLGGYAAGALAVWIAFTSLRLLLLFPLQQHRLPFLVSGPLLFRLEAIVILVASVSQFVHLRGTDFSARSEWWPCFRIGAERFGMFLFLSTVLFFPVWYALKPRTIYEGYIPSPDLVPSIVRTAFPNISSEPLDVQAAYQVDVCAAIPNSFVIATVVGVIGWLICVYANWVRRQMNRTYYWEPEQQPQPRRAFGGGYLDYFQILKSQRLGRGRG